MKIIKIETKFEDLSNSIQEALKKHLTDEYIKLKITLTDYMAKLTMKVKKK